MKREEIEPFLGKKVNLVVVFSENSPVYYYTGYLLSVNDDTVTIKDKYDAIVKVSNDKIKKIAEFVSEDQWGNKK